MAVQMRLCQNCAGPHYQNNKIGRIVDKDLWFYDYAVPADIRIKIQTKDAKIYSYYTEDENEIRGILKRLTGITPTDCLKKESDIVGKEVKIKFAWDNVFKREEVIGLEALT